MNKILLRSLWLSLALVFCATLGALAQRTVTGTVTSSEDNTGMPGVSVTEKGTTNGTVTDVDGSYTLSVNENATLVFSFVGFTSQELAVGAQSTINITLSPDVKLLSEVVVVAYGTQERREITSAVASVKGSEIIKSPSINVSNSLAGRLPGLVAIGQSGEPGDDFSTLLVRGLSTINDNRPLIVVDGVPNRSLERIDPSTIESISVVKDASAAIYGSQAANGLIIITTKRGKAGKMAVNASFNLGFTQPTRIPELTNAYEFGILHNEIDEYRSRPLYYSDNELQMLKDGSDPWRYPNTDWFDEVLKPWSVQHMTNVSVSGGSDAARVFVSFSTRYQDGFYNNSASDYRQHDMRINFDTKINEYISFSADLMGRLEDKNFPTRGSAKIFQDLTSSRPDFIAHWPNGLPGPYLDPVDQSNPVVTSTPEAGYIRSDNYVFNFNARLNIKIPWVKGLSLTGTAALDRSFYYGKNFYTPYTLYDSIPGMVDVNNNPVLDANTYGGNPSLNQNNDQYKGYLLNAMINYEKTIANDHTIKLMAGGERMENLWSYLSASRNGFIGKYPDELHFGLGTQSNDGITPGPNRWAHLFGRVQYDFKDKFLAEFVWRYQGSSKFANDVRNAFFPGVSLGYRISEENFWRNSLSFVNNLKLRASWGKTGNDLIDPYQFLSTYSIPDLGFISYDPETGVPVNINTLQEDIVPYPRSRWEEANQFNIGFDMVLLENKINFTADYFNYKRTGILIPQTSSVPSTPGFPQLPDVNKGEASSKGFDFIISYSNSIGDLKFTVGANGGLSKSKTVDFDEPENIPDYQQTTGRPLFTGYYYNQIFYRAIGIYRDQAQVDATPHINGAVPGDIIFDDYNDDGFINADDKVALDKNHVPTFTGGFTLNMNYHGFDLSVLFQGASGGIRYLLGRGGENINFLKSFYDQRWTEDNRDTDFPRTFNRNDEYWVSSENLNTFWIRKTDYVRLKNVELGYTLPASLMNKLHLTTVRIYVSGLNLFTISPDYKDYDPEMESKGDGFAGQGYPLQKIINTGISVQF